MSSSGMGRCVHSLMLSIQLFPLPTTASPILQGPLKDGFGEAVVACDMPEPCKFPSSDSCQKRFLWIHKKVDHARTQSLVLCSKRESNERQPFHCGKLDRYCTLLPLLSLPRHPSSLLRLPTLLRLSAMLSARGHVRVQNLGKTLRLFSCCTEV